MKTCAPAEDSKDDRAQRIVPIRPSRRLIDWAVTLTVENIKPYVRNGCLWFAKSRSLKNRKTMFVFAFEESAPIGFCAFRLEGRTCFVYEIHVHPGHRSRQVGTRMLDCVSDHVVGKAEDIALQVHKDNKRAEAFYARYGFVHDHAPEVPSNYNTMRMPLSERTPGCSLHTRITQKYMAHIPWMGSFDDISEFIRIETERAKNAEALKTLARRNTASAHVSFNSHSFPEQNAREHAAASLYVFEEVLLHNAEKLAADVVCEVEKTEDSMPGTDTPQDARGLAAEVATNIPFSGTFISKVFRAAEESNIFEKIREDERSVPLSTQREMTMEINKRLSQVSTEKTHLDKIHVLLKRHSGFSIFVKLFVHKILDQGRLQVTKHPKSYIAYSYIFCTFYSREMMNYFRIKLFTLNAEPLYGVYSTYFGILKLKQNVKEAHAFIASVTGACPSRLSGEVVEWFLTILGSMLATKIPAEFSEVCRAIEHNMLHRLENRACAERIKSATSSLKRAVQ
ncbi:UNVERIFIED_CONTAM: hypothetical protein PYX00_011887 [Menopon gallinae]|uniref:N-alpha-acetyltransferase 40 n=1 Tax=Menopon gallinae TaxID=328185 RepID=A0AAW2H907_9NEOP